jgi:hypothetical protein
MKTKLSDLYNLWPNDLILELQRNYVNEIVPFKELGQPIKEGRVKILEVPFNYIEDIIRNFTGLNGEKPYKDAYIELIETKQIEVANLYSYQTFVQRDKLNKIKELKFPAKPSLIIYEDKASLYLPPLIDDYSKVINNFKIVRDGTHRMFCHYLECKEIPYIIKAKTNYLFVPSFPVPLYKLKIVDKKPPLNERYINLKKEYWIDLKKSGIDG